MIVFANSLDLIRLMTVKTGGGGAGGGGYPVPGSRCRLDQVADRGGCNSRSPRITGHVPCPVGLHNQEGAATYDSTSAPDRGQEEAPTGQSLIAHGATRIAVPSSFAQPDSSRARSRDAGWIADRHNFLR